jgi:glycerophosphoryl diester phosphodiesterase
VDTEGLRSTATSADIEIVAKSPSDTPLVIAHRGASGSAPEHTLSAYRRAIEEGADGFECDVRLTRDRVPICFHDRHLHRTSNGSGLVSTSRHEELLSLDVGSWHGAGSPEPVLALDDLLTLTSQTGVKLFIETKHPVRYGLEVEEEVFYQLSQFPTLDAELLSFSKRALRFAARRAPSLPRVALLSRSTTLVPLAGMDLSAIGPSIELLRRAPHLVAQAKERGWSTYVWTVDEDEDARFCRDLGVDVLITNRPGKIRSAINPVKTLLDQI